MRIKEISIKRFRGIKDQTITDIDNALVLIGKNNSGKSAVLTAIRLFFGNYSSKEKDFYKQCDDYEIAIRFYVDDEYLLDYFLDSKIGYAKVPSKAAEFNETKEGTVFADNNYNEYKEERDNCIEHFFEDEGTRERFEPIWLKAIKKKFAIENNSLTVVLSCRKNDLKPIYSINDVATKDISVLFPDVAFIDDTRYFEEEETGKTRSITSNIFGKILKSQSALTNDIQCDNCSRTDCDLRCINDINRKSPDELTIEELQKLINYKTNCSSEVVTQSISENFQNNYQSDYKIRIKATSNIDKSFSIITKIYDPYLDAEIELSNVGAGLRSIYILSLLQSFQKINSKHTIFIIEEPELYLHPQLQKDMASTLSQISQTNQVLFTTHSPIMLREFNNSEIRKVRLDPTEYFSIVENTTIDDVLEEIGYSSQDILNTDFIVFVEGPDDKTIYELILKKYYNIENNRLLFVDTNSCKNIGFYATLKFLRRTTMSNQFAIIRDADTEAQNKVVQKLKNQLTGNQFLPDYIDTAASNLFVTKYSSIEGYLFEPRLLVNNGIKDTVAEVFDILKNYLVSQKESCIAYFRKHNQNEQERIDEFLSVFDEMVDDVEANIEWVKTNIRGHNYYNVTESRKIAYEQYINELPKEKFEDILAFFDRIDYFTDKINH